MKTENKRKQDLLDIGFRRVINTFVNMKERKIPNLNGYALIVTNLICTIAMNYLFTWYSLMNCMHIIFIYGSVVSILV